MSAPPLAVFDRIISDRGSVYAVSGGPVADRAGIDARLAELKSVRRFAKATHNSWAARLGGDRFRHVIGAVRHYLAHRPT